VRRATIADVAREAGVSKGAVSYALNGRPGVSDATRARIVAVAERVGFRASAAARALAGAPSGMVGLALRRPARTLAVEPFFMELISGLEEELSTRSYALLLHMVDDDGEAGLYRTWRVERRVDGVVLCDVRVDDPRLAAVPALGLPAVLVGPPAPGRPVPAIWSDDAAAMTLAVEHLAGQGHRRIARVAGLAGLAHTAVRTAAFDAACRNLGVAGADPMWTDYSGPAGAAATRALLSSAEPPTAIVYDNDIMAVAGLAAAREAGVDVPGELSLIAGDDSPICAAVHPALTALTRDVHGYGVRAARLLLAEMAGHAPADERDEPARLTVRASTGPNSPG
jgi:DNA-binding LacI/PurR family transcriptional regulator